MRNEYNYRTAVLEDVTQLKLLGLSAYGQYRGVLGEAHWKKMEANLNNENTFVKLLEISKGFICETRDEIVGMAFLIPQGNATSLFADEWSYIRLVGVHPGHNGKGIGKILTQQCVDFARASGEKTIALHTSEFQDAARHIYENMGFKRLRELDPIFGKKYFLYTLQINT